MVLRKQGVFLSYYKQANGNIIMHRLFIRPKPARIMVLLRDSETAWHLSKIAKSSETTYVYVTKLMGTLQKGGYVAVEAKGNRKVVKLTEKGSIVANMLHDLMLKMQG